MSNPAITHGALDHAELATHGLRPEALLDFSSNINPFGPPPAVRHALAAFDPAPYPDRSCLALCQALAAQHACPPNEVLPGNGSNELIHLLARALLQPGDAALIAGPTFGEYRNACVLSGARVSEVSAHAAHGFALDTAALLAHARQQHPRLLWLCSPNNPTGTTAPPEALAQLAHTQASHGGWLVLDHAYAAFARPPQAGAVTLPHTLHLHSLTKSYGMAGVRLGYLHGPAAVLAQIAAFQPAWSVGSAAQVAGVAALNDTAFLAESLPRLWQASDALHTSLAELGLAVWRASQPFMLVRTGDAAATRRALLARGCLVRDCSSFGLPEWVRIAPRQPHENARLIAAWKELV